MSGILFSTIFFFNFSIYNYFHPRNNQAHLDNKYTNMKKYIFLLDRVWHTQTFSKKNKQKRQQKMCQLDLAVRTICQQDLVINNKFLAGCQPWLSLILINTSIKVKSTLQRIWTRQNSCKCVTKFVMPILM